MDLEQYAEYSYFFVDEVPEWVSEAIEQTPQGSIVDLGSGEGVLLMALHRSGRLSGRHVVAVDGSQTRLERLRVQAGRVGAKIETLKSDVVQVPLPSGETHLLLTTQVIEHVPDDRKMVTEIARLLRPGGYCYLSTVFKGHFAWYFHRCNGRWTLDPTHLREYRRDEELLPILEECGIEVIKQKKSLIKYAFSDFVFRRLNLSPAAYESPLLTWVRFLKIPIVGYYNWEIVGRRKS